MSLKATQLSQYVITSKKTETLERTLVLKRTVKFSKILGSALKSQIYIVTTNIDVIFTALCKKLAFAEYCLDYN